MKGVYFYEKRKSTGPENVGIDSKILEQINSLKTLGELKVVKAAFEDSTKDKIAFVAPFIESRREKDRKELLEAICDDTNYIYIRKPSLTINFYKLLKTIRRKHPSIIILLEIPTYPFHSEYTGISKLNVIKSIHCERKLRRVVDRIITYSDDDKIWEIPTIKMANCVVYDKISPRSKSYKTKEGVVRLTCVANFMYWHGVDRLINGMKDYRGDYKIVLNIVGGGKEIPKLKQLSEGMENVVFHGTKTGAELTNIFDETDIAVDALGRHRSGVYYNSSLKGKEYVARGIPVASAVKTELDSMKSFPYYLKLPADDSDIDVQKIIDFYEKIYSHDKPRTITDDIRKLTEKYFDYKNGFTKIIKDELIANNRLENFK